VFGMTLTELPSKEKITVAQKRAAQRSANSQSSSGSSATYILTSLLPASLRAPTILAPPKNPNTATEAAYTGLYSFIVSIVYLSQGNRISEGKLERYLKKCNADEYVLGGEKTENILKRMERHGYLVKVKDREPGGEEIIDWIVGPRGKTEIGEKGVAGMVKEVYGKRDNEMEDLEDMLERSLGKGTFKRQTRQASEEDEEARNEDEEVEVPEPEHGRSMRSQTRRPNHVQDEASEDDGDETE
jgi:melanoma-associated antigen